MNSQYQLYFEQVFSKPLDSLESARADLCQVAELVWFHRFVPALDRLGNPEAISKAAYVVDYLASNHLVPSDQKRRLKHQLEVARMRLAQLPANSEWTFYVNDRRPRKNRDPFADRWHLVSGMKPKELGLLDMQRRASHSRYGNGGTSSRVSATA